MVETKNPWTVNSYKLMYDNPWISVTEFDVLNPSGGKGIYGKIHFKNIAIGIVALDDEMNIYLVGQFRFVLNEYSWEIPEGGCPEGENALEAAQRELLEETGLIAQDWQEVQRMHLSNSVSDELAIIYVAKGLKQGMPCPEDTEALAVKKLPFDEAIKMMDDGKITDSITVAAFMKVQRMITAGKL